MEPLRSEPNTLLFLPNLVVYVRFLFLIVIPFVFIAHPVLTVLFYMTHMVFDVLDGYLARQLGQESYFGMVIDMLVDRAIVAVLICINIVLWPKYNSALMVVLVLDFVSHFSVVYLNNVVKSDSHKSANLHQTALVKAYYSYRYLMGAICFCHDAWLCALYLAGFYDSIILHALLVLFFPGFILKLVIHCYQLKGSLASMQSV